MHMDVCVCMDVSERYLHRLAKAMKSRAKRFIIITIIIIIIIEIVIRV
jgi:hypothetical protein